MGRISIPSGSPSSAKMGPTGTTAALLRHACTLHGQWQSQRRRTITTPVLIARPCQINEHVGFHETLSQDDIVIAVILSRATSIANERSVARTTRNHQFR